MSGIKTGAKIAAVAAAGLLVAMGGMHLLEKQGVSLSQDGRTAVAAGGMIVAGVGARAIGMRGGLAMGLGGAGVLGANWLVSKIGTGGTGVEFTVPAVAPKTNSNSGAGYQIDRSTMTPTVAGQFSGGVAPQLPAPTAAPAAPAPAPSITYQAPKIDTWAYVGGKALEAGAQVAAALLGSKGDNADPYVAGL